MASESVEDAAAFGISPSAAGRFGCSFVKAANPGELEETDAAKFSELVKAGFSERRKQVRKLLGRYGDPEKIEAALLAEALPLTARAEDISLRQWIRDSEFSATDPSYTGAIPDELLSVVDENDQPLKSSGPGDNSSGESASPGGAYPTGKSSG